MRQSGQLERIVAALERHLERERVDVAALTAEGAPGVGAVAAIWAVWQRLGLDGWFAQVGARRGAKALEDAVFAMVANRLVAPRSKRQLVEWTDSDVVMPDGWSAPSLDQYYRALDGVAAAKDDTETHLYTRLCDLGTWTCGWRATTSGPPISRARPAPLSGSGPERSATRGTTAQTGPR